MIHKMAIAVALTAAATTASAVELGIVGGGATGSNDGGLAGVTVGEKWGKVGLTAGYAQAWLSKGDQNRWTVVGSYDVYQNKSFVVSGKVGYAYLNQTAHSGSAGLVGVGVEIPLNNKFSLTADYTYQFAQNSQNNANVLTGGIKYRF